MIDDYFFYYSFMFLGNRSSSSSGFQKQINIPPAVNLQSDAPQDDHVDRRAYVKSSETQRVSMMKVSLNLVRSVSTSVFVF